MTGKRQANYRGKSRNTAGLVLGAAAVLVVLGLILLIIRKPWAKDPEDPSPSQGGSAVQSNPGSSGSLPQAGSLQAPETLPPYDFSQPVPEGAEVENSYFDDAAFIGDSRTDGFMLYSGIGTGDNLAANGVSMFRLSDRKSLTINGEKYTPLEALALKEYGKVYLALGVNELGYNNDKGFYNKVCEAIDGIRRAQPNAVIYIQGLIPVNEEQYLDATGKDYLTNDHLRIYNDLMQQAAEEKKVAYVNVYEAFADENGGLPEEDSRDGVHLYKEPCQRWLAYLKTHTVEFDALYPDGPPEVELEEPEAAAVEPETTTGDGSGQE